MALRVPLFATYDYLYLHAIRYSETTTQRIYNPNRYALQQSYTNTIGKSASGAYKIRCSNRTLTSRRKMMMPKQIRVALS